jgi:hypothetical protein
MGLMGSDNAVHNRAANLIGNGLLRVRRSRNEKLVLDVDKVAGIRDDLNIGIGNGMLSLETGRPLGRAA